MTMEAQTEPSAAPDPSVREAADSIKVDEGTDDEETTTQPIGPAEAPEATDDPVEDGERGDPEAADPETPSSLFARESLSSTVQPDPTSGGLGSSNEQSDALNPSQTSGHTPNSSAGRVTFSLVEPDQDEEVVQPSNAYENSDRFSKQRTASTDTVGFTQVDERAPNINLRFFRGLGTRNRSQRRRNRERRAQRRSDQEGNSTGSLASANNPPGQEEMVAEVRPMSNINLEALSRSQTGQSRRFVSSLSQSRMFGGSNATNDVLISATLVEEEELEYAVAEEMSCWQKRAKVLIPSLCFCLILLVSLVSWAIVSRSSRSDTEMPSEMPSSAPSQDPRPTLEIVQERGHLLCGVASGNSPEVQFWRELCRSVAAVVVGNPNSIVTTDPITFPGRFDGIRGGAFDLVIDGDTHTIEREVLQSLSFSVPYFYDGASYNGNEVYVNCAYDQKRYDECEELKICFVGGTTAVYVQEHWSPEFWIKHNSYDELFESYKKGTCNVVAGDRQAISAQMLTANLTDPYVIGEKTFSNEPLSIVTRNDESEWNDIVNWVVHSLIYGEKVGLRLNQSECDNSTPATVASELNYLNAVNCVGNYWEIFNRTFGADNRTDINGVNLGTGELMPNLPLFFCHSLSAYTRLLKPEMLYVTPFGNIYDENAEDLPNYVRLSTLHDLMDRELHCGVVVQSGCEDGNEMEPDNICGMSVDFCHTLAASIYDGNPNNLNLTIFQDEARALTALNDGTVDLLSGVKADLKKDFGVNGSGAVTFSMPFFYGNETGE